MALERAARYALEGRSKFPLLDACRALKRMGANTKATAGLFRPGRVDAEGRGVPDLTCTVGKGAATTVIEPDTGRIRFGKWAPHPMAMEGVCHASTGGKSDEAAVEAVAGGHL